MHQSGNADETKKMTS